MPFGGIELGRKFVFDGFGVKFVCIAARLGGVGLGR